MKIIYYVIFVIFLCSCGKENPFDNGSTVAITGFFSQKNGAEIYLSRGLDYTKTYYINQLDSVFNINNASATLWDENKEVLKLYFVGKGKYTSKDSNWMPTVDTKYKIVVDVPSYGIVESDFVTYPVAVKVDSITYIRKFVELSSAQKFSSADMTLFVNPTSKGEQFYEVEYNGVNDFDAPLYNLFVLGNFVPNPKFTEAEAINCGVAYSFTSTIFPSGCLKDNKLYDHVGFQDNSPTQAVKQMNIKVHAVSANRHKQLLNARIISDIDTRFQEVPATYTNIKNGIGYFYAKNESDKVFVVKR